MYIRSRQEALDALAEVLQLPERTAQIVKVTVLIAMCLEPDARRFLMDCQAGIIEEGLTQMKKRRQEAIAALRETQPEGEFEGIIILDSEKDELLEQIGTALDTLRMVQIIREVFPALARRRNAWEVGRAVLADEAVVREILVAAVRHRGQPDKLSEIENDIEARVLALKPGWSEAVAAFMRACQEEIQKKPLGDGQQSPADDPELLFSVIALSDDRAATFLDCLASEGDDASQYLGEIRRRIQIQHEAEQQSAR